MTATTEGLRLRSGSDAARAVVELLSSMRFSISLLSVICIASVIGTVLRQQEPLANYVNQFGPFWADVFTALRLDTVYSAWWFLLILAFLVVSTSLCIARNTPKILADLRAHKENIRERSLLAFHHRAQGELADQPEQAATRIGSALARSGWKVRLQRRERAGGDGWMVAARAGAANKIGYLAAHSAIVLVCLGGLLDGDLVVRTQMWLGNKVPYRGSGTVVEVPEQHRLPPGNPTFRGNVFVPEGAQSAIAVINQGDGVVLQDLPFSIELRKFIVEYYSSGMPKMFASDVVIHDRITGQSVPARVEVNHPVRWRGVEIYQSSFDDGGSRVKLQALPLDGSDHRFDVEGTIGGSAPLARGAGDAAQKLTLEFTALRVINVENFGGNDAAQGGPTDVRAVNLRDSIESRLGAGNKTTTRRELRNVGPSISYKLRDEAGQAREFNNYMLPVNLGDTGPVFLFGMRETPAENFRYLRIPVDEQGGLEGFLRLRRAMADGALREQAVRRYAVQVTDPARPQLAQQLAASAARALELFVGTQPATPGAPAKAGLQAISEFMETNVPVADREKAGEVVIRILSGSLFELNQLARQRAGLAPLQPGDAAQAFMSQAVLALSDLAVYPAPMVFQLRDFTQVQASVFQVTRSPGHYVVYLGCALLILGVFAMLYIRERRLWVWLEPSAHGGGSRATMALSSNRRTLDADREWEHLRQRVLPPQP